jgi:hypothetical protein
VGGRRSLVGEENVGWHRLNPKKDLRCMDSEEDRAQVSKRKVRGKKKQEGSRAKKSHDKTGEGRRMMSWIWLGVDSSADATNSAVADGTW